MIIIKKKRMDVQVKVSEVQFGEWFKLNGDLHIRIPRQNYDGSQTLRSAIRFSSSGCESRGTIVHIQEDMVVEKIESINIEYEGF